MALSGKNELSFSDTSESYMTYLCLDVLFYTAHVQTRESLPKHLFKSINILWERPLIKVHMKVRIELRFYGPVNPSGSCRASPFTYPHFFLGSVLTTAILESAERRESLRKHAYSNILKILPPKNEFFSEKNLIFLIFLLKT